ncbi:hypothetical protein Q4F19_14600, partial [Sphingomonas sp. BIUV-7]
IHAPNRHAIRRPALSASTSASTFALNCKLLVQGLTSGQSRQTAASSAIRIEADQAWRHRSFRRKSGLQDRRRQLPDRFIAFE